MMLWDPLLLDKALFPTSEAIENISGTRIRFRTFDGNSKLPAFTECREPFSRGWRSTG